MIFAIAGNPNSGKTTLFNALTGATAHTGNWPGVTIDRKEGIYRFRDGEDTAQIVDLPGIYSLSPYSPEEVIARNYLIEAKPDVIIDIVDATNLQRNLYLTTQILETDIPTIIALNMMDVVERNGGRVDAEKLAGDLGIPVVPISALAHQGIDVLMERARGEAGKKRTGWSVLTESDLLGPIGNITAMLREHHMAHPVFHAVKMLESDAIEIQHDTHIIGHLEEIKRHLIIDEIFGGAVEAAIADARYRYIDAHFGLGVSPKRERFSRSDRIDRALTHRVWGIPIFLFFMFAVFHLTFGEKLLFISEAIPSPGVWLQGLVEGLFGALTDAAAGWLESASPWVSGILVDGLLAGLSSVLSFLPQILLLFLFLSILEDSGYMARAAFLIDRVFRRLGLSGRSFLPLLMGFGCSVPAMMATRTLENQKDRRLTVMLTPFFSCGAKLPIWALFGAALFPGSGDLMVYGIYILGILVAVLAALILKRLVFKGEAPPFIMELPAYHLPKFRNLLLNLWDKLKHFIYRAATIIAGATMIIWLLSNFSFSFAMVEANSAESILGVIGSFLRPVFAPLGFASGPDGWKAVVAILTGLIAKEMVVSTMGVLYPTDIAGDALKDAGVRAALLPVVAAAFSPAAALSFMAFNLLSVPCMAAVGAMRGEMRSAKWIWGTIGFWILTAWIVSFVLYQAGRLFGL